MVYYTNQLNVPNKKYIITDRKQNNKKTDIIVNDQCIHRSYTQNLYEKYIFSCTHRQWHGERCFMTPWRHGEIFFGGVGWLNLLFFTINRIQKLNNLQSHNNYVYSILY